MDGFLLAAIIDLRKAEQVAARISRKPVQEKGKPVLRTLRNTRKII